MIPAIALSPPVNNGALVRTGVIMSDVLNDVWINDGKQQIQLLKEAIRDVPFDSWSDIEDDLFFVRGTLARIVSGEQLVSRKLYEELRSTFGVESSYVLYRGVLQAKNGV